MLTHQQIQTYVDRNGVRCPFCESHNIEGRRTILSGEDGTANQPIECLDCHKEWWDVYMLTSVKERTPGDEFSQMDEPLTPTGRIVTTDPQHQNLPPWYR